VGLALRAAVLLSGAGSTFQNLLDLSRAGALPIDVRIVVATKAGAYGLERARAAGIANELVARKAYADGGTFGAAIDRALAPHDVEVVLMAGLIHLWRIPPQYEHRVINVHPSLIPAFCGPGYYDLRVHQAVVDSGVRVTGCTVHYADDHYDHGPIILQRTVEVGDTDTAEDVRAKVQALEREAFPEAIRLHAAGRLRVVGRRVRVVAGG